LFTFINEDEGDKLVLQFMNFHFKFVDLAISYMKEVLTGAKSQEERLIKSIDNSKMLYYYTDKASKNRHKSNFIKNLRRIINSFNHPNVNQTKH
jgi:hypothetical protein